MLSRKYRIHAFLAVMALVIIFYPIYQRQPDSELVDSAQAAAVQFLEEVDNGHYERSWRGAASYLQEEVPLDQWQQRLSAVRSAAGALEQREREDYSYTREAREGIPEGEYMVFTYQTTFRNAEVTETLTLMRRDDGPWLVAGYFID